MVLAVAPSDCAALEKLCAQHGVEYTDLGGFTGDGQLTVRFNGDPVLNLDTHFLHNGRPQRQMRAVMPTPNRTPLSAAPTWLTNRPLVDVLLALLSHPNIASKASVIHRYDHEIRGATAVRNLVGEYGDGHGDGVVIAEPVDDFGFAIGIGVNPWYGVLDPHAMALAVIDEAMRNVVAVGADPDRVALLDNFSWGDPRRASTLGDLLAAVDGCCAGALAFGAPFVSGKDSLNNEYMGEDGERHSVPPTLVITSVAHVPDAARTVTADLKAAGNVLMLLGNTSAEFGGSHAAMIFDPGNATNNQMQSQPSSCGPVPQFDSAAPSRYRALHALMQIGLIKSCHDCSEGGVGVTIAEMVIAGRIGARIDASSDAAVLLFSESLGRFVVEVAPDDVAAVLSMIADCAIIGETTTQQRLVLPDGAVIEIAELLRAWSAHS
jgi:phosphoribosylformylglycinamidine synthase